MESVLSQIQSELNIPSFSFNCRESGEQLNIAVFNGRIGLTVWAPKGSNQKGPVFKQSLTPAGLVMFKKMLADAETMVPNTRKPLLFCKWDDVKKAALPDASFIFGKDEKQQFFFEIQFKFNDNNKVLKFDITASATIQDTTDFSWQRRSAIQVEAITDWFNTVVPIAQIFTSKKQKFGGGTKESEPSGDSY